MRRLAGAQGAGRSTPRQDPCVVQQPQDSLSLHVFETEAQMPGNPGFAVASEDPIGESLLEPIPQAPAKNPKAGRAVRGCLPCEACRLPKAHSQRHRLGPRPESTFLDPSVDLGE